VVLLIDIVEEVSGTTAFIVGKFSFEWLAALRKCSLLHSFEGVMVVVRVDLKDDVLAVPASEVVEFVHAAACDHLCWLVSYFASFGQGCGTADSAIVHQWSIGMLGPVRSWVRSAEHKPKTVN
jgi:hypothetical protein